MDDLTGFVEVCPSEIFTIEDSFDGFTGARRDVESVCIVEMYLGRWRVVG